MPIARSLFSDRTNLSLAHQRKQCALRNDELGEFCNWEETKIYLEAPGRDLEQALTNLQSHLARFPFPAGSYDEARYHQAKLLFELHRPLESISALTELAEHRDALWDHGSSIRPLYSKSAFELVRISIKRSESASTVPTKAEFQNQIEDLIVDLFDHFPSSQWPRQFCGLKQDWARPVQHTELCSKTSTKEKAKNRDNSPSLAQPFR